MCLFLCNLCSYVSMWKMSRRRFLSVWLMSGFHKWGVLICELATDVYAWYWIVCCNFRNFFLRGNGSETVFYGRSNDEPLLRSENDSIMMLWMELSTVCKGEGWMNAMNGDMRCQNRTSRIYQTWIVSQRILTSEEKRKTLSFTQSL